MEYEQILQERVAKRIAKGVEVAKISFETLDNDLNLLQDYVAPFRMLAFLVAGEQIKANLVNQNWAEDKALNSHALGQLAERNKVPARYLKDLAEGEAWKKELAVQILNKHTFNSGREKVLLRTVGGQLRGVLSDRYRRLDSRQIVGNFLTAASSQQAVLVDAHTSETRFFVEVIRPDLIKIETPNNGTVYMVLGAQLKNSDFGAGKLEVNLFGMQAVCLNGMVIDSSLKQVHLGRQLPEDLKLSQRTYDLDTDTQASLVTDVMEGFFKPEYVQEFKAKVEKASATEIDAVAEIKALPALGLLKAEVDQVEKVFMNNRPDDGVVGASSLWKMAQAVGAVARDLEPERGRELMAISGNILTR